MARNKSGLDAKCLVNECNLIVKTPNSETSGCRLHLKNAHGIEIVKQPEPAVDEESPPHKITKYMPKKETYPAYMARLCAVLNLTFSKLASPEFQDIFTAKGFGSEVVKSPNTVREYILSFAHKIRAQISNEIREVMAEKNTAISLTTDEWTSTSIKKFMAVNVHVHNHFWHLGLYRMRGSCPATKILPILREILREHDLNLEKDVIGITSDAATVMKLLGKISYIHTSSELLM